MITYLVSTTPEMTSTTAEMTSTTPEITSTTPEMTTTSTVLTSTTEKPTGNCQFQKLQTKLFQLMRYVEMQMHLQIV